MCHWLLKRGINLSWIIGKIHYSERQAADRATTDASLQVSSNFYFKFWTLALPFLYRFSWNAKWTGGKSRMRRDQWCNRGGLLVIPPAARRVMWLVWNSATPNLARGHFLPWTSPFTYPFTIYAVVFVSGLCEVHNETRTLYPPQNINEMLWKGTEVLTLNVNSLRTVLSLHDIAYNCWILFLYVWKHNIRGCP